VNCCQQKRRTRLSFRGGKTAKKAGAPATLPFRTPGNDPRNPRAWFKRGKFVPMLHAHLAMIAQEEYMRVLHRLWLLSEKRVI